MACSCESLYHFRVIVVREHIALCTVTTTLWQYLFHVYLGLQRRFALMAALCARIRLAQGYIAGPLRPALGFLTLPPSPVIAPAPFLLAGNRSSTLQSVRNYARVSKRKEEFPSQLDDLPPTMLTNEYANVELVASVDDVVKRLLTLEMASRKQKVEVKIQQLMDKVKRDPHDKKSIEARIAKLTGKIRNYQERIQKHPKDKVHKRFMLLNIDRRQKLLKHLRNTHYSSFENVCQQLDITYTFPPEYYRRATHRWVAKKAFCRKVYLEVQKRKVAERLKMQSIPETSSPPAEGTPV